MIEINVTPALVVLMIVILFFILFKDTLIKKVINITKIKIGHISIEFIGKNQSRFKKKSSINN